MKKEIFMAYRFDKDEVERSMMESRKKTRESLDLVIAEADLRRSPGGGFRPLLWHLGHVGAFEEYWLLGRLKGDPPISARYAAIFDPIKTPREDSRNLPPIPEIESFLARVREEVLLSLKGFDPNSDDPLLRDGYIFDLVIEHEYQHQETLLYLLQMLDPALKRKPAGFGARKEFLRSVSRLPYETGTEMVRVAGGLFEMGSDGYPFAYDNERPPRMIELSDFRIDKYPVTNTDYARFIEAGGYETRSLWSDEGWEWKEKEGIRCPLYWSPVERQTDDSEDSARWLVREMFEERRMEADLPVVGVSWHEAEAYARFVGKRLPTEAEWEKAASWDPEQESKRRFSWGDELPRKEIANSNDNYWGTTPVAAFPDGRSAYGCFDLTGNVWEWTASTFASHAGFEVFPYPEYSELWFDGDHRVLKGGSWATRPPLLRCSFRNFFRPRFRIAFAGFRCAAD
ncbi:MAG: SUMF1/EgtB/PvdO family nonheme iron enzyme [Blastocatellia bacterium]|nr:SUMF1/EgtB/PvdO family nonheme iron enzyme [Blastocatellia bacterium]